MNNDFKYHKIFEPVYAGVIILCYGPKDKYIRFMKKRYGHESTKREMSAVTGRSTELFQDETREIERVLWVERAKDIGTIAHEAVHIANFVFSYKEMEMNEHTDEFYAYYIEFIINQFLKLLKRERTRTNK